jgi:hypothetical protein
MIVFYAYTLSSSTSYICERISLLVTVATDPFLATDQPFATSGFQQHAVIGTIGVVTNLISGTAKPFIAKVSSLA